MIGLRGPSRPRHAWLHPGDDCDRSVPAACRRTISDTGRRERRKPLSGGPQDHAWILMPTTSSKALPAAAGARYNRPRWKAR
ncbi:hypothetical protein CBM2599_B51425 [Cupriavidus taiwanensis]|nr:hypothetical protein CBM2599_B51425 [Cupriavidus taiwanensis]SOZ00423.1 hypothetical protein CBM2600_B70435 [Cupriavidus taiwanensis]